MHEDKYVWGQICMITNMYEDNSKKWSIKISPEHIEPWWVGFRVSPPFWAALLSSWTEHDHDDDFDDFDDVDVSDCEGDDIDVNDCKDANWGKDNEEDDVTCVDVCLHDHRPLPRPDQPDLKYHQLWSYMKGIKWSMGSLVLVLSQKKLNSNLFCVQVLVHGALRGCSHLRHERLNPKG